MRQDSVVVAYEAHNLMVVGAIPTPAPKCNGGGTFWVDDLWERSCAIVTPHSFGIVLAVEVKTIRSFGSWRIYD